MSIFGKLRAFAVIAAISAAIGVAATTPALADGRGEWHGRDGGWRGGEGWRGGWHHDRDDWGWRGGGWHDRWPGYGWRGYGYAPGYWGGVYPPGYAYAPPVVVYPPYYGGW